MQFFIDMLYYSPSPVALYVGLFYDGTQWSWQDASDVAVTWADAQPISEDTDRCASVSASKGMGLTNVDCSTALRVLCEVIPNG